ncbi:hypothetical protein ACFLWC_01165 [Chloroflexota bacterium]
MSLLDQLIKLFRIKRVPPLTESEAHLFMQLQSNREAALQSIPDNMKKEFLSSVYSNRGLKQIVIEAYRNQLVSEDRRGEYIKLLIAGYIGIRGFGTNLILRHGIDPEDVYKIMLRGINS